LLPPRQYTGYIDLLEELHIPSFIFEDGSTLGRPTTNQDAAQCLLTAIDSAAANNELVDETTPLVLIAHSRGAKAAVLAAQASTRPVAAMLLLDPVDATVFDNSTVLPALRSLRVPIAILGSGAGAGECAPRGGNYESFFFDAAAPAARVPPRLLAFLKHAGHTQYLDDRRMMLDVCTAGTDDDLSVRDVALAVMATFLAAFVPGVAPCHTPGLSATRTSSATTIIGTGRASANYLLLADRTGEACAVAMRTSAGRAPRAQAQRLESPEAESERVRLRMAECLSALRSVRFRAEVDFDSLV
jgi:pimeloyl-ACP methyl ester carboxylesterase